MQVPSRLQMPIINTAHLWKHPTVLLGCILPYGTVCTQQRSCLSTATSSLENEFKVLDPKHHNSRPIFRSHTMVAANCVCRCSEGSRVRAEGTARQRRALHAL
eukprot:356694-Chlamydomonas_euryale.AAC.3